MGGERERGRGREREGERGRAREDGALAVMFELSARYLNPSWWMLNSCIARKGERAQLHGFSVQ